jgi:hypothetical protein
MSKSRSKTGGLPAVSSFWRQVPKSKLRYDRRSVGQSILVPGTHLGPFLSLIIFRQLRIRLFGRPL